MSEDLQARLEQALASNAALLDLIHRFRHLPEPLDDDGSTATWARAYMEVERGMDAALKAGHPGAALLREVLALRRVMAKIREYAHAEACTVSDPYDHEELDGCNCALALLPEADAAKEKP